MNNSYFLTHVFWGCLSVVALSACGSDETGQVEDETGQVEVRAYGESFIEDGIPSSELEDSWAIRFSRFEVTVKDVVVGGANIPVTSTIDLTGASSGEGHVLGDASVATGDHTESQFTISRVEVDGEATKGEEKRTFSWVFDQPTTYVACETTTAVKEDSVATFQITVHADHLFYDSLVSENPDLLFQALADADSNADQAIEQSELSEVDIGAYDPGNESDIDNLWAWLVAQNRTLGHVDGEGHCDVLPSTSEE